MSIEKKQDFAGLKEAGRIVRLTLEAMRRAVRPGVTTLELDAVGAEVLAKHGAKAAPKIVYDFPGSACISLNEEIVHGIPSKRIVEAGDLVKLDVVAEKDGYLADAAVTVAVPPVSEAKRQLIACAEQAFFEAMDVARAGHRLQDIGRAIEREVRRSGFAVVRELCGHGVGRSIHEAPNVLNFYDPQARQRLTAGLVLAIEPMIAQGSGRAAKTGDGWTIRTADGSLSAHFEHTVVITSGKPILLTAA